MPIFEIAIWSVMFGGILTLVTLAVGDAVVHRSATSTFSMLCFVAVGASCVVMTGLPEALYPDLPRGLMMTLKVFLGPMAGAMALYFLGVWLGGLHEDELVHRLTAWGGAMLMVAALALMLVAWTDLASSTTLLGVAALVNGVPVVLALVVVARSAVLGDPLARWMLIAVGFLALMTTGMYAKGLNIEGLGLRTWALTAASTLAFFSIVLVLVQLRLRQQRKLMRLLSLELGADPATGLPTGQELLSKVEHAFWRAARLRSKSTVICICLTNLYERSEPPVPGSDHQVLVAMAARIRNAAGFRCVVGLYHPRCFVVVLSTEKSGQEIKKTLQELRTVGNAPVTLIGEWQTKHVFRPLVGIGTITVQPPKSSPMAVINDAERAALQSVSGSKADDQYTLATAPGALSPSHF